MTSVVRKRAVAFLISGLLGILPHRGPAAEHPLFTRAREGGWTVTGSGYAARINAAGCLSSLTVGEVEAVGVPLSYQPNARLVVDDAKVEGDALRVHLKGTAEATLEYRFRPDGFTITPTWKGAGYAEFRFTGSPALLGIELLNDKSVTRAGDATQFQEHGEIRGVPAVPSSRNQMVRFHYPGFSLHAYVQAWGAPFNYESAGGIQGYGWGRPLLAAGKPFPIVFTIRRERTSATLPALPFVPRTDKASSLYYANEPCAWNLDLGPRKAYRYLLDAGVRKLDLAWYVSDVHDREVARGKNVIALGGTGKRAGPPITIRTPGTGYYQVLFVLADPSKKALASGFRTRFTVIHPMPGRNYRDDAPVGKGVSPFAIMAMIGIGGIRESHSMKEFFADRAPQGTGWVKVEGGEPGAWMNVGRLDELFDRAFRESRKYPLAWFFQANERPPYATPALYEAMAFALVERYKDRCRVWEVENEPNFHYSPQDYVKQCLIPFARGARRADPGCVVMGPGCVGLKDTLRFLETIYALHANTSLDHVSTHTYPGPGESWEQFGNVRMLRELRRVMREHGEGDKPVWQTEQGYAWDNAPRGQAARYAVRQFLQGWRLGIEPSHQYYFYPDAHGFESWYLAGGGEQGSVSSWLPAASALRFLAENTAGMHYVGDVPSPYKGIYLARFAGAREDVVAAWTFDFPYALAVRAPGLRRVVGYMGNPLPPERVKHGLFSLPLSGEPVYVHLARGSAFTFAGRPFGTNLAAAAAGATAAASSAEKGKPAAFANDGNWELWEPAAGLPGRTAWKSGRKDPSTDHPDWLQITFPRPRTIDRIVALCYLPAVNASPRDWAMEVAVNGGWRPVASGRGDWTWVLQRTFPPVTTSRIRLVITRINDGWQGDRRWMHVLKGPEATGYTDSKMLVSELEAYGPPPGARENHAYLSSHAF